MKVWKVVSTSYCNQQSSGSSRVRYKSYNEAKKCFDYYRNNRILNNDVFCNRITLNKEDVIEYNDGKEWSYGLYIIEENPKVYDTFDSKQLDELY